MSKVVEAARRFKQGRDFEWMLQPNWDTTDEHRTQYIELSLMMVAERLEIETDYPAQWVQNIVAYLDSYAKEK